MIDLEAKAASLRKEIAEKEAELSKKREEERKKGEAGLAGADLGDEDWTINERGEVRRDTPAKLSLPYFSS